MFEGASEFNQPLNNWDVSNVKNMSYMFYDFYGTSKFNQTLIDVSNMIDINLFNIASEQISKLLNVNREPFVKSIEEIGSFLIVKLSHLRI